jgi:phage shock protein PspC (stress-responsive transcriptional regulator)
MFCSKCGFAMEEGFVYCGKCGHAMAEGARNSEPLRRVAGQKKVAGVCAGVAKHFHVDESLVRVVWAGSAMLPFTPGGLAYLLCWAVIPQEEKPAAKPRRLQRLASLIPGRRRPDSARAA